MNAAPSVLERRTHVAPLGVRFWDDVSGALVSAGLRVTAYPLGRPDRPVPAILNRAHTFVWHNLPGLSQAQQGAGDEAYWQHLPPPKPFVVEVTDPAGCFIPCRFSVNLPVRDVLAWPDMSPPGPASPPGSAAVPLFSAPARPVPGGLAAIRAELHESVSGEPAAWARVEAWHAGQRLARGLADQRGRVVLIFAYPELSQPVISPPDAPSGGGRVALTQQSWPIDLKAFFSPQPAVPAIPDWATVSNQLPAALYYSLSPPQALAPVSLTYGRELVVTSASQSVLWISGA
jgi:hypothetical protein